MGYNQSERTTAGYQDLQIVSAESKDYDASVASSIFITGLVRIHVTTDSWLIFGEAPVAVAKAANTIRMAAETTEYFRVNEGEKVAIIKDTGAGVANIANCY